MNIHPGKRANFKKDLERLVNRYSLENESETPDFILAEYLVFCLENYNKTSVAKDAHYGIKREMFTETATIVTEGNNA